MSLLGAFDNLGLFVGKVAKPATSEMSEGAHRARETCDLPDCGQPATQAFDSVRVDDGPLYVCNRHTSDVRRWVG